MSNEIFNWDEDTWKICDLLFEKKNILIQHKIDSFNHFIEHYIPDIVRHHNPLVIPVYNYTTKTDYTKTEYTIKFGRIYMCKPTITESNETVKMLLPNEARMRDLTYAGPMFIDVEHSIKKFKFMFDDKKKEMVDVTKEYDDLNELNDKPPVIENKVFLGKIPICIGSKYCYLHDKDNITMGEMGEGEYDFGGYYIVNGSEKVIIGQERPAENRVLCFKNKATDTYPIRAEIKSTINQRLYPIKRCGVNMSKTTDDKRSTLNVELPGPFQSPGVVPLFVMFRALGVISDKEIFQYILGDIEKADQRMIAILIASAEEAKTPIVSKQKKTEKKEDDGENMPDGIKTQIDALKYLSNKKRYPYYKLKDYTSNSSDDQQVRMQVFKSDYLNREFLPHVGTDLIQKAYFLGYMTRRLLQCYFGIRPYDDRDSYSNKRADMDGQLLAKIFSTNFTKLVNKLTAEIKKKLAETPETHSTLPSLRKTIQSGMSFRGFS